MLLEKAGELSYAVQIDYCTLRRAALWVNDCTNYIEDEHG